MHNVFLIAKREYLERIRTKAFLLSTILIPLLMGGGLVISTLSAAKTKSASHVAIVSSNQTLAEDLKTELEDPKRSDMKVDVTAPTAETRAALDHNLAEKTLDGYLWIAPAANPADRPVFTYYGRSKADIATQGTIESALRTVLLREGLVHHGITSAEVEKLLQPVDIQSAGGSALTSFLSAYIMFFLMYFVVMLYGMNVARSIIEEKTSRVFEVLLSTITPDEILAGKIIGVGSVGLSQIILWLATAVILTSTSVLASFAGNGAHISLSMAQIVFFLIYFVLGFLLYSSIAAALGAMVNSEQELQQLNMFLVMPLAVCMFSLGVVITNPSGLISTVISLIPFCTPLIMYFRISLQMPPAWQIALSLVLMIATNYGILWVASRIYRVGILMYGKKPNLPEILRWLKYS